MSAAPINPARLRLLLVERGMSFSEVADALGVSRNVVAGLARRNGITRTASPAERTPS